MIIEKVTSLIVGSVTLLKLDRDLEVFMSSSAKEPAVQLKTAI